MPVSLIKGSSKDSWFVLTADSLSWYKDKDVSCLPFHFKLVWSFNPSTTWPTTGEGATLQPQAGGHEGSGH